MIRSILQLLWNVSYGINIHGVNGHLAYIVCPAMVY